MAKDIYIIQISGILKNILVLLKGETMKNRNKLYKIKFVTNIECLLSFVLCKELIRER